MILGPQLGIPLLLEAVAGFTHLGAFSWQFGWSGGDRWALAGPLSPARQASFSPEGVKAVAVSLISRLELEQHHFWCILLVKASPKASPESS